MVLTTVAVENYRSLRRLVLPLGQLTVITGANGSGKSNLYRALRLLAEGAGQGPVAALAREGGLESVLWAGPEEFGRGVREGTYPVQGTRRREPIAVRLGFSGGDFGYAVDLGLPAPITGSAFNRDPEIKREVVWTGPRLRPATVLADRRGPAVKLQSGDGGWEVLPRRLPVYASMLGEVIDPFRAPELITLREQIRGWRFYDHLRTDRDAPARIARPGTRTPVLDPDGADLAAALQTVAEIGDVAELEHAVQDAFPDARLEIEVDAAGRFDVLLHQHGLLRPLRAAELSDGTLRYLLWVAALLTPRPPALMVLNEPEGSLHLQLLPALARLMVTSAAHTQLVAVSHSATLIQALRAEADRLPGGLTEIELVRDLGRTQVAGQERFDQPPWTWPKR